MTPVKVTGLPVVLDGQTFICPPLNFRSLQALQVRLSGFKGDLSMESVEIVLDAAHAALARNYPDMTRDFLIDSLDVANMTEVMQAVMDVSGLARKAHEDASMGEAPAPLIGAPSMPA